MAEKTTPGKVETHPLVQALVPDPNQPPQPTVKLLGLPGASPDASATRLWLDHELSSYVDVPSNAVLYSKTLPEEGGSVLWVSADAKLNYGSVSSHAGQESYLGGSIVQQNLAGAYSGYGASTYAPPPYQAPYGAPSLHAICPTPTATPSVYGPCHVTHTPPCPTPGTIWSIPIFLCPVTHMPPCGPPAHVTYDPQCGPPVHVTYHPQCPPPVHVTYDPHCGPPVHVTYHPQCPPPVHATYGPQCAPPIHITYLPHCAPTAPATIGAPCTPVGVSVPIYHCPVTHRLPVCPPIVSRPPCTVNTVGCPPPRTVGIDCPPSRVVICPTAGVECP